MYPQTTSLVASDVDDVDDQIIFESGQIVFVNFSKKNIPVEIVFEIEYICMPGGGGGGGGTDAPPC